VRAGRRIADARGNAGRTLCGAELTSRDIVLRRGVANMTAAEVERFNICSACLFRAVVMSIGGGEAVR
jgi:hypothetical protein